MTPSTYYHVVGSVTLRNNFTLETSVFQYDTRNGLPIEGVFSESYVSPNVGEPFGGFTGPSLALAVLSPGFPSATIFSASNSPPYFTNNSNQQIIEMNLTSLPANAP